MYTCTYISDYTYPYNPWTDHELERLRELERQADIEAEKARIRRRLREKGVNPNKQWPLIYPVQPIIIPHVKHNRKSIITVDDVLKKIHEKK